VVGGGNVLRGAKVSEDGLSRPTADAMGMLATVMNALVLVAAIEHCGASARAMSALIMPQVCETYERQSALRHLEENRIIASQAALEIHILQPTPRRSCAPPKWNATPC